MVYWNCKDMNNNNHNSKGQTYQEWLDEADEKVSQAEQIAQEGLLGSVVDPNFDANNPNDD